MKDTLYLSVKVKKGPAPGLRLRTRPCCKCVAISENRGLREET